MVSNPHRLNHEDLDVYQASIRFFAAATRLIASWPRGHGALADQFRRAATSIPLNIAEGAGRNTIREGQRFYGFARGSAHECGAILDAARLLGIVEEEPYLKGKATLVRIVSMLVRLSGL